MSEEDNPLDLCPACLEKTRPYMKRVQEIAENGLLRCDAILETIRKIQDLSPGI